MFGLVVGWLSFAMLVALGLVFIVSLMFWLIVMLVFSLVSSWITGRPATVTLLWQRYRAMARRHWPQRAAGARASAHHRASATGSAAADAGVQDVAWREVRDPGSSPKE